MRILSIVVTLTGLALGPSVATADCACLCLDGGYRPVCTAAEEVGRNRGLCHALANRSCPEAPDVEGLASHEPPLDGVDNCRDAQVFDGKAGEYLTAKVCEVVPEG